MSTQKTTMLFKRQETMKGANPHSLLEGMSDYFVLQAHNKRNANDYSPNKKCDWTLVTKAIFNPQAPQHKIFKDNLSKVIEDNSRYNSTKMSRQSMSNHEENEQFQIRKKGKRPQTTNQRLLQYFSRVEQKIQELNELKTNLNSYKEAPHQQMMNKIKIMNKYSAAASIRTERLPYKQIDIDEMDEKENQLPMKQVPIMDKDYACSTKASEAKKIDKLEQREFKIKVNKQSYHKRRHTLNINIKQPNWTSRLVSKCENQEKSNVLAMSLENLEVPSKLSSNGGISLYKEVNQLRFSQEFTLKPYAQELKLFRRPATTAYPKTGQTSVNSNSLVNIKI